MSPLDPSPQDALRGPLEEWLRSRHQALLEEVVATWQQGLERFHPDELLLEKLAESMPSPTRDLDFPTSSGAEVERNVGAALDLLDAAESQSEVLHRLLDGIVPLSERGALFILKQGIANLYAWRGFDADAPQAGRPVVPPPALEPLIQGNVQQIAQPGPAYTALLSVLSRFEATDARIYPLRLKRKPVALLMVDSGLRQRLDHPQQIRALVMAANAALAALAAAKEEEAAKPALPAQVPSQAETTAPSAPPESHPETQTGTSAPTQVVTGYIPEPSPASDMDPKTRANAERLARVLVGDVELYFPAKVAQAKAQGNLYGLLRDELDRSRANFVERFGEEAEDRHRIFLTTVVDLLCDGHLAKLGAAPWA